MGKGNGSISGFAGVAYCGASFGCLHGEVSLLPPLHPVAEEFFSSRQAEEGC